MYTDEDLTLAIKSGIFTDDSVSRFRAFVSKEQGTVAVDEENLHLVTGFNDFFVVIACALLLISIFWLGITVIYPPIGALAVAATSWGLSEFFVLRRKMALPAIVLLATFIGSIAWFFGSLSGTTVSAYGEISAGFSAAVAARFHWLRFKVPITVAAGVASIFSAVFAVFTTLFPETGQWPHALFIMGGVLSFYLAMRWDAQDTQRQTRKSDIAFWLHLLAAPLFVHPVFSMLGVFEGGNGIFMALVVISLYITLAAISIAIDRRALMVCGNCLLWLLCLRCRIASK